MGLAASQARFLSLTARKNDLEYLGQQVNQQRTNLAYQMNTLFDQLVQLDPPAPKYTITDAVYLDDGTSHTRWYNPDGTLDIGHTSATSVAKSFAGTASNNLDDEYDSDKLVYDAELTRVNSKLEKYHNEDRILEMQLKNIDSQHNAVQTEIEAVKKVIDKNIDMTFKTFA